MVALLYFSTSLLILWLLHRHVTPLSRAAALSLLLLPLVFTGRAVLGSLVYAPIDIPYLAQPLHDRAGELGIGAPKNPVLSDIALQMIPWRQSLRQSVADREWPLWNRFERCGDMLAASAQPAVFSPFTWIALILPAALSFTYTGAITFFVAGVGAFLFARELRCSEVSSLLAAAIWAFSAPMAGLVLWPLGFAWSLCPLVLMATKRVIDRYSDAADPPVSRNAMEALRPLHPIAWLTIALLLEIVAGHPETLLHVVAAASAYGVFELSIRRTARRTARPLAALVAAGVLALLLGAVALLPFIDAERQTVEHSIRHDFFARMPLKASSESVTAALVGNAFPFLRHEGESMARSEAGSIALALALLACWRLRSPRVAFFAALAAVSLLAGSNAWPVAQFLHSLPLFDVALNDRLAAVVPLCIAVLAALSVDSLRRREGTMVMIGLSAIIAAAALMRPPLDALRFGAELVPLAVAAAFVFFARDPRVPLLALILAQRTMSDGALVPVYQPEVAYPRLALLKQLEGIPEPFRIVGSRSAMLQNTATMYGLEDVRGSSPMTLRWMAELAPLWARQAPRQFDQILRLDDPLLSMMNVRYALLDVSEPIPSGWRDLRYEIYTRLIENPAVLGRAFVPHQIQWGASDDLGEMRRQRDFTERAWINTPDRPHQTPNGPGIVKSARRRMGLQLDADMSNAGFVVISEAAWNGWRAWLDGSPVKVERANHAFLAVWVPAGHHSLRLKFLPRSFVVGRAVTVATATLLLLMSILYRVRRRTSALGN